jgi:hypothetical protein
MKCGRQITKFVRMKGNVKLESFDKSIKVNASNVLHEIRKNESSMHLPMITFPSLSPIDVHRL